MPIQAAAYLRRSTSGQGESLAEQKRAVRRLAAEHGAEILSWHQDTASGGLPPSERPTLMEAADAARAVGGLLLASKRDRLGRTSFEIGAFEAALAKDGVRVATVDTPAGDAPDAVLHRRIVDAFAEYERLVIRARTRAALASKRARGERVGAVPLGASVGPDGRRLAPHAGEADALARARELRAEGLGWHRVAAALDREGFPPRGRRWYPASLRRALGR